MGSEHKLVRGSGEPEKTGSAERGRSWDMNGLWEESLAKKVPVASSNDSSWERVNEPEACEEVEELGRAMEAHRIDQAARKRPPRQRPPKKKKRILPR